MKIRRDRLVEVVRALARRRCEELETLKQQSCEMMQPDFVWRRLVLNFFATRGESSWHGLSSVPDNDRRITYEALAALDANNRKRQLQQICWASGVGRPNKKAECLLACFNYIQRLGGPEAAKARLFAERGAGAKIRFLRSFPGIGPRHARSMMIGVYHEEFRNCIVLDVGTLAISRALGLSFPCPADHVQFYLGVARDAGLNGWELDRLLHNFRPELELALGMRGHVAVR